MGEIRAEQVGVGKKVKSAFKMMNFSLKMMNFALNLMNLEGTEGGAEGSIRPVQSDSDVSFRAPEACGALVRWTEHWVMSRPIR